MRAVVLVGGEGTRLRPLTETTKKELLPLVDRPILDHIFDHLVHHGVTDVVLSSSYLGWTFDGFIEGRGGSPRVAWIEEAAPLGTGGAIVNALDRLDGDEPFFALNGDILTDLDLSAMAEHHRRHGAAATIALTHVEDARPFGLVSTDEDGRVVGFLEKPAEAVPGNVNAGTYVLEPSALATWEPGRNASIEREIFPALIDGGRPVYGFRSDAYWMDLGTPEKYLQAHFDVLEGLVATEAASTAPFVGKGASVHLRAHLGRWVILGAGVTVAADARVDDSVVHPGATIGARAVVSRSIVGSRAAIGADAVVQACVVADEAEIPAAARLDGVRVAAGQGGSSA